MYKIVFMRHGESTWNLANRFTGWVDVDLTEKGVAEARQAGKLLKEAGQHRSRCAVILGREFQDGVVVVKDLDAGEQHDIPVTELESTIMRLLESS